MSDYYCSRCRKECQPQLCEAGVSADCCEESPLMVRGEGYETPSIDVLRFLMDYEETDLAEKLHRENDRESTRAMRARDRVMGGS